MYEINLFPESEVFSTIAILK